MPSPRPPSDRAFPPGAIEALLTPPPPPVPIPPDFESAARAQGIEFEPGDLDKLARYLALLFRANQSFNLTSEADASNAWSRHILDSLTLLPLLAHLPERARIIDIGSGGGLPGIPLAIALPRLRFTLLEATGKKAEFLCAAAKILELRNVSTVHARAEELASMGGPAVPAGPGGSVHRDSYDAAVARAVGRLSTLAELTLPFVKPGGRALLIKGAKADEELAEATRALELLNTAHAGTIQTPTGRIIVLEKLRPTPLQYPRRSGEPKRAPL